MALAGVAAGADGLIVEMHPEPDKALTDTQQTIDFKEFSLMVEQCRQVKNLMTSFNG